MTSRFSLALLASVLVGAALPTAALAAGTPPPAAPATSGIGLAPCTFDPNVPATRSYFIPTVKPGDTYTDCVNVSNLGPASIPLFVSAVDGLTAVTSGAVYANRTDPLKKWGKWVSTPNTEVTVPAKDKLQVKFTVHVPADASPGDHLAGLAFEPQNPKTSGGQVQVTTIVRSVIGILVKVPGPAAPHLKVSSAQIEPLPATNTASVVIQLTDDGLLLTHPKIVITLDGPNGYHKTVHHDDSCPPDPKVNATTSSCPGLDTILPGDSIPFPFPWPETLAEGDYTIVVDGTCDQCKSGAHYQGKYSLKSKLAGTKVNSPVTIIVPATPWFKNPLFYGILVLVSLLLFLLVFFLVILPRRKEGPGLDPRKRAEIRNRLHNL